MAGVPAGDPNGHSIFNAAHDETLQKWIDAAGELTHELKIMADKEDRPELVATRRVADMLVLARRIRWAVTALEVFFPVVLAIAAISIVWLA